MRRRARRAKTRRQESKALVVEAKSSHQTTKLRCDFVRFCHQNVSVLDSLEEGKRKTFYHKKGKFSAYWLDEDDDEEEN